jgi:hypothetical protein
MKLQCNVLPPVPASQPRNGDGMECHHGSLGLDARDSVVFAWGPDYVQILARSIIR